MKTLLFLLVVSASSAAQSHVCAVPCAMPASASVVVEMDAVPGVAAYQILVDGFPVLAPMVIADGVVQFTFPQGFMAGQRVFQIRSASAPLTDPTPLMICGRDVWAANYYPNATLAGLPTLAGCEVRLAHAWGTEGPPGFVSDDFSARYLGTFTFASAASQTDPTPVYLFTARIDDGMRAWVDTVPLLDSWHDQGATTYTATRSLSGSHQLRVEYYEHGGEATTVFGWQLAPVAPVITLWTCTLTQAVGTYSGGDKKATVRCPSSFTPVKGEAVKVTR